MKKHFLTGLLALLIGFSCNTINCGTEATTTSTNSETTTTQITKSSILKKAAFGVIGVAIITATIYYIYENPGSFDPEKIKQLSWDYLQKAQETAISAYEFGKAWTLYGFNIAKYWFGVLKETMAVKRSLDIATQVGKGLINGCKFGKKLLSNWSNRLPCWGTKVVKNPAIN